MKMNKVLVGKSLHCTSSLEMFNNLRKTWLHGDSDEPEDGLEDFNKNCGVWPIWAKLLKELPALKFLVFTLQNSI